MDGLLDRRQALVEGLLGLVRQPPVDPSPGANPLFADIFAGYQPPQRDVIGNISSGLARAFSPAEWQRQAQSLGQWPDPRSVMSKGILGTNEDIFNMITNIAPLGIFKGINANLSPAETEMLQKAFALEQQGMGREAIRQATNPPGGSGGWFRAPWDQKWRMEVDDSAARQLDVPSGRSVKAPQYLEHPDLYAAYPQLENLRVTTGAARPGGGAYQTGINGPYITTGPTPNKSITLHEFGHGVQDIENFARGGQPVEVQAGINQWIDELNKTTDPEEREAIRNYLKKFLELNPQEEYRKYLRLGGEAEARLVQARRDLTPTQRAALDPIEQMDTMLKQEGILGGLDDLIVRYGDGPAMSAPKIERYSSDVTYRADPDEYVYHVTTEPKARRILEKGFDPKASKTVKGGFYENYSKDKVFFTDKDGLGFWRDRIEEHLDQAMDNPPALTVLRIKKSELPGLKADAVGTKDAHANSWFLDSGSTQAGGIADELPSWAPAERMAQWRAARANAALPVEQGGLGLGPANTAAERAKAGGYEGGYWHETEGSNAESLLSFDPRASVRAASDEQTPYSVFVKNTPEDIGVAQNPAQMPLFIRPGNKLTVENRDALEYMAKFSGDEAQQLEQWKRFQNLRDYDNRMASAFDDLEKRYWLAAKVGDEEGLRAIDVTQDKMLSKWKAEDANRASEIKDKFTRQLEQSGIDSINLVNDKGSFNRNINTTMVLNPANIRSRFAAFDPKRRNEADLLASWLLPLMAGGGLLGGYYAQPQAD